MVLLAGAAPADAQQAGNPAGTTASTSAASQRTQSKSRSAVQRAKRTTNKQGAAAAAKSAAGERQPKPWSLRDALPDNRYSAKKWTDNLPTVSEPQFGRVPLERGQGSFGFESETSIKPNQLYDGQPTPGLETVKRDPPSYFGLSLSVPSNNKTLLPPPVVPPWGRPE